MTKSVELRLYHRYMPTCKTMPNLLNLTCTCCSSYGIPWAAHAADLIITMCSTHLHRWQFGCDLVHSFPPQCLHHPVPYPSSIELIKLIFDPTTMKSAFQSIGRGNQAGSMIIPFSANISGWSCMQTGHCDRTVKLCWITKGIVWTLQVGKIIP